MFLPLEHAQIAGATTDTARTTAFARYSLTGSLCAAIGAVAVGIPEALTPLGVEQLDAMRWMFVLCAVKLSKVGILKGRSSAVSNHFFCYSG